MKGTVYENYMINLGVSNYKLYLRTIGIISTVARVSSDIAESSLLRTIFYETPYQSFSLDHMKNVPVKETLILATSKERVVPTAILLSTGLFATVQDVLNALKKEPILRNIIREKLEARKKTQL